MTAKEIKDIINKYIDFYRDEMTFSVTEIDYHEFLGACKACVSLLRTIDKEEKQENDSRKNP